MSVARLAQRLRVALDKEIAGRAEKVSRGEHEPGPYKLMCGEIRGLKEALRIFNEQLKKLREDDG